MVVNFRRVHHHQASNPAFHRLKQVKYAEYVLKGRTSKGKDCSEKGNLSAATQ